MRKKLSKDLHSLLSQYLKRFTALRDPRAYPGSTALIDEYEKISQHEGDDFFSKFGVGNDIFTTDRPFERARAYELLLHILQEYDHEQYLKIHKGTPYFFIGWTAFQHLDFEKAMFYMDAAVSEDIRRIISTNSSWDTKTPSIDFMLLNPQSKSVGILLNAQLQSVVTETLSDFFKASNLKITSETLVKKFIQPLLFHKNKKHRSIITALYRFFIEFNKNKLLIELRSSEGGSIDPILSHLFQGARVLESMLEVKGGKGNNLKSKVESLTRLKVSTDNFKGNKTLKAALNTYNSLKESGCDFQNYNFATSYVIRNTTGHSLVWSDEFKSVEAYETLYKAIVNSIFWTIQKLWINNIED